MRLIQIGVTKQEKIAVYIVDGVTVTEITGPGSLIDSTGRKWSTHTGYLKHYSVGDNIVVTHAFTKDIKGPTLHNKESSIIFHEVEV